ncbi:ubiquinone anaerobic biosynthesis accessory factor UbiT [Paraburkholderia caballeronis]|uniref:Ubiquinone biosynthesis accessory factor UbiT n=1 Tax=Paraburkholderia caballeronis TaxID=416943 RepID=A0A1H7FV27_9BURK|nr:SCP2 sterol-binding domain-containing protein [Paraburkholderia caballeronis]PXW24828.1 putative lipid carrier protein YhbT [Paraburkholderia caballeronis]PXX00558.1 putative lipid carrier protein YhbT [Paraburkholderia caballeronis]RAJ98621.1 putative lipid carrier protein YhbT [Paraburkholderia caballeronis]SEE68374.1 Predicted lipid carrier protein YhbT, contains SCP2 domain [Paraburkholderia caballeronis]SEK29809.1 Predicted lipid carrier protein YhbT, contains SCP2 domain [Paraburkhold
MAIIHPLRLPSLRAVFGGLPARPPAIALAALLNLHLLPLLDAETRERLERRRYVIDVTDVGIAIGLTLTAGRFAASPTGGEADLCIAAGSRDFLRLAAREIDADTLFFARRLTMQGDTELGLIVRNAIDAVDFDATRDGRIVQSAVRRVAQFVSLLEKRFGGEPRAGD